MIRNRMREFYNFRRQRSVSYPGVSLPKPVQFIGGRYIIWQNDYYHFKQALQVMSNRNQQIKALIEQYAINSSVYNLRQLEGQLNGSCKTVDEIQYWISHFVYTQDSTNIRDLEKNMIKNMKNSMLNEIKTIFSFRQQIADITNQANNREKSSFNAFNQSVNVSYNSLNQSMNVGNERNAAIREVTARIQNLNLILRRMGDAVAEQGSLIDRIDQNLKQGHRNVMQGGLKLKQRLKREEGDGDDFSCEGRVNKIIMCMYIVNLILIFVLVIKNI